MKKEQKLEIIKKDVPICKIDHILKNFALKYNKAVNVSYYHDWPSRSITFTTKSKNGNYFIVKSIYFMLLEWGEPFKYKLTVFISTRLSIKSEIVSHIPLLKKFIKTTKPFRLEKKFGVFTLPIDGKRLENLLNEAKSFLDNFQE